MKYEVMLKAIPSADLKSKIKFKLVVVNTGRTHKDDYGLEYTDYKFLHVPEDWDDKQIKGAILRHLITEDVIFEEDL